MVFVRVIKQNNSNQSNWVKESQDELIYNNYIVPAIDRYAHEVARRVYKNLGKIKDEDDINSQPLSPEDRLRFLDESILPIDEFGKIVKKESNKKHTVNNDNPHLTREELTNLISSIVVNKINEFANAELQSEMNKFVNTEVCNKSDKVCNRNCNECHDKTPRTENRIPDYLEMSIEEYNEFLAWKKNKTNKQKLSKKSEENGKK